VKKEKKDQAENLADVEPPRRSALRKLWQVLGFVVLAEALWLVASFLRPRREQSDKKGEAQVLVAGRVGDFLPGTVTAFPRGRFYLARLEDGGFLALSRTCTHLGCTVPWVEEEKRFVCPCHASAFDITGRVINSPAPRALDIYPIIIENKIIKVDTGTPIKRSSFRVDQVTYPKKKV